MPLATIYLRAGYFDVNMLATTQFFNPLTSASLEPVFTDTSNNEITSTACLADISTQYTITEEAQIARLDLKT